MRSYILIFMLFSVLLVRGKCLAYRVSENVSVNGSFEVDADNNGVPDGWRYSYQRSGSQPEFKVVSGHTPFGNKCIKLRFKNMHRAHQVRLIQFAKVKSGRVYQLTYWYKSAMNNSLKADVMLTNTGGPIFLCSWAVPGLEWKRCFRLIPITKKNNKPIGIYVQNRSAIPIWYDNIELRETDIKIDDVVKHQFKVEIHPIRSDDVLITPNRSQDNVSYLVEVTYPPFIEREHLRLQVRVIKGKKIKIVARDVALKNKQTQIDIPISRIYAGKCRIHVILSDKTGNTIYAHSSVNIEKLTAESARKLKGLNLERTPVLEIEGKPVFPIGMFGVPASFDENGRCKFNVSALADLSGHKYNVVHNYLFAGTDIQKQLAYLDEAWRKGYYVMAEMPRKWAEQGEYEQLAKWLKVMSKHRAVLFYYSDEMFCVRHTPIKYIRDVSKLIKKIDSERKWIVYEKANSSLIPYVDGLMQGGNDFITAANYRSILGEDKVWIATVHIAWQRYNRVAPNMDEQRYLTFMPIILGARGIFFWMWSEGKWHSGDADYMQRLGQSVDELASIVPAIISGDELPSWYPEITKTEDVSVLRCAKGKRAYLLVGPSYPTSRGFVKFKMPRNVIGNTLFEKEKKTYQPSDNVTLRIFPKHIKIIRFRLQTNR